MCQIWPKPATFCKGLATSRSSKKAFFHVFCVCPCSSQAGEHYFRKTSLLTQSRVNFAEMWNSIISSNSQKLWENVSTLTKTCYFLQGLSDVKKLQKSFFHVFCVCIRSRQARGALFSKNFAFDTITRQFRWDVKFNYIIKCSKMVRKCVNFDPNLLLFARA